VNDSLKPNVIDHAPVNGLRMYYEIYGSGQPLVLLHGGMTTVEDFGFVVPTLAKTRQVIAFERQGHGHTADIDRPFSLEQWADDTAALLQHLNIEQADIGSPAGLVPVRADVVLASAAGQISPVRTSAA
jgi:pimeloyl-ACP methyl ester carboxylesterase